MKTTFRVFRLVCVLSFSLLAGCAGLIHSNVAVFHELPASQTTIRYIAVPFKSQEGSLEHKSYEGRIKAELNKRGFVEAAPTEQADVVLFFSYGIDGGKEVISSYPIYGKTGTAASYTSGTITGYGTSATYSGTTYNTPTHGVVGTGVTSDTVYTRFLKIEILDRSALNAGTVKRIYDARVVSSGSTGQVAAVMPTMIKALFEDFPGKSGGTRKSILPMMD